MERGGSVPDVMAFGKNKCGLFKTPCLLDYHAQYVHLLVACLRSDDVCYLRDGCNIEPLKTNPIV